MPWVRLDDGFTEHPKLVEAGPLALAMYVAGLCYANRNLTDGFVPAGQVPRLVTLVDVFVSTGGAGIATPDPFAIAETLVDAGLWMPAQGGYVIHDFHSYQPRAADVRARARHTHERKAAGGRARAANAPRTSGGRFARSSVAAAQRQDDQHSPQDPDHHDDQHPGEDVTQDPHEEIDQVSTSPEPVPQELQPPSPAPDGAGAVTDPHADLGYSGPRSSTPLDDELPHYPRTAVRGVACPSCEAAAGQRCTTPRGADREANHRERVEAYHRHATAERGVTERERRLAAARGYGRTLGRTLVIDDDEIASCAASAYRGDPEAAEVCIAAAHAERTRLAATKEQA